MRGFCIFLLAAIPARAAFVKPSLSQTAGSSHYAATSLGVDFGDAFHVKPTLKSYHSDDSSGTYRTWGLRMAYDLERYSYAVSAGFTPLHNGYKSRFLAGEASASYDFEEGDADRAAETKNEGAAKKNSTRQAWISRIDLTGIVTLTNHTDQFILNAKGLPIKRTSEVFQSRDSSDPVEQHRTVHQDSGHHEVNGAIVPRATCFH